MEVRKKKCKIIKKTNTKGEQEKKPTKIVENTLTKSKVIIPEKYGIQNKNTKNKKEMDVKKIKANEKSPVSKKCIKKKIKVNEIQDKKTNEIEKEEEKKNRVRMLEEKQKEKLNLKMEESCEKNRIELDSDKMWEKFNKSNNYFDFDFLEKIKNNINEIKKIENCIPNCNLKTSFAKMTEIFNYFHETVSHKITKMNMVIHKKEQVIKWLKHKFFVMKSNFLIREFNQQRKIKNMNLVLVSFDNFLKNINLSKDYLKTSFLLNQIQKKKKSISDKLLEFSNKLNKLKHLRVPNKYSVKNKKVEIFYLKETFNSILNQKEEQVFDYFKKYDKDLKIFQYKTFNNYMSKFSLLVKETSLMKKKEEPSKRAIHSSLKENISVFKILGKKIRNQEILENSISNFENLMKLIDSHKIVFSSTIEQRKEASSAKDCKNIKIFDKDELHKIFVNSFIEFTKNKINFIQTNREEITFIRNLSKIHSYCLQNIENLKKRLVMEPNGTNFKSGCASIILKNSNLKNEDFWTMKTEKKCFNSSNNYSQYIISKKHKIGLLLEKIHGLSEISQSFEKLKIRLTLISHKLKRQRSFKSFSKTTFTPDEYNIFFSSIFQVTNKFHLNIKKSDPPEVLAQKLCKFFNDYDTLKKKMLLKKSIINKFKKKFISQKISSFKNRNESTENGKFVDDIQKLKKEILHLKNVKTINPNIV